MCCFLVDCSCLLEQNIYIAGVKTVPNRNVLYVFELFSGAVRGWYAHW